MGRILIPIIIATSTGFAAYAQAPNTEPTTPNRQEQVAPSLPAPGSAQPTPSAAKESATPPKSNDTKLNAGHDAQPAAIKFVVTAEEEKNWIGKPVYSSDNEKLGEITGLSRDANNNVTEVYYESGGFLGIGTKHYGLTAADIRQVQPDRLVVTFKEPSALVK